MSTIKSTIFLNSIFLISNGLLYLGASSAMAQDIEPLSIDASQCINISIVTDRIACYDALARKAKGGAEPSVQPIALEPSVQVHSTLQVTPTAEILEQEVIGNIEKIEATDDLDDFGFDITVEETQTNLEIHSQIVSLRKLASTDWVVTLENGQVWQQTNNKRLNLREGYLARIYKSKWSDNAYRLSAEELSGFIAVRRLK